MEQGRDDGRVAFRSRTKRTRPSIAIASRTTSRTSIARRTAAKTWQKITRGLPAGVYLQTVKEDPKKRGLLVAGTELGVFVSFNDGDDWQSLQLNLPPTSNRDLAFKDNDLIVATHGRGFWVLDDISALRQMGPEVTSTDAFLFKPGDAIILPTPTDDGTPTQKDEAWAENPPTGAIVDYYLQVRARAVR